MSRLPIAAIIRDRVALLTMSGTFLLLTRTRRYNRGKRISRELMDRIKHDGCSRRGPDRLQSPSAASCRHPVLPNLRPHWRPDARPGFQVRGNAGSSRLRSPSGRAS